MRKNSYLLHNQYFQYSSLLLLIVHFPKPAKSFLVQQVPSSVREYPKAIVKISPVGKKWIFTWEKKPLLLFTSGIIPIVGKKYGNNERTRLGPLHITKWKLQWIVQNHTLFSIFPLRKTCIQRNCYILIDIFHDKYFIWLCFACDANIIILLLQNSEKFIIIQPLLNRKSWLKVIFPLIDRKRLNGGQSQYVER